MDKGTIVYIGGFEMPDGNAAAHRVLNNAKIFKELGFKVVFCGVDKGIKSDFYSPIDIEEFQSYPEKYPSNSREWLKKLYNFKHAKFVLDSFKDLRIAIAYNMHAKPLQKLLRYCKKRNVKLVTDVTEWYNNPFSLYPMKFLKWFDTKTVMEKLIKKSDGVIAISNYLESFYKAFLDNVVNIPPLVDISEDIWHQEIVEKIYGKTEIVYAGLPGRDKDQLDLIINSVINSQRDDFHLNIMGVSQDGFTKDYPELKQVIDRKQDILSFRGKVSHRESIKALLNSDYCLFFREASKKNNAGFPTKFSEAVTSGTKIITNRFSNIADFCDKDVIVFQSIDFETICEYLKTIHSNSGESRHIKTTFDYHNYIVKMEVFLENVFNSR